MEKKDQRVTISLTSAESKRKPHPAAECPEPAAAAGHPWERGTPGRRAQHLLAMETTPVSAPGSAGWICRRWSQTPLCLGTRAPGADCPWMLEPLAPQPPRRGAGCPFGGEQRVSGRMLAVQTEICCLRNTGAG